LTRAQIDASALSQAFSGLAPQVAGCANWRESPGPGQASRKEIGPHRTTSTSPDVETSQHRDAWMLVLYARNRPGGQPVRAITITTDCTLGLPERHPRNTGKPSLQRGGGRLCCLLTLARGSQPAVKLERPASQYGCTANREGNHAGGRREARRIGSGSPTPLPFLFLHDLGQHSSSAEGNARCCPAISQSSVS
jgi:hypothetical protein